MHPDRNFVQNYAENVPKSLLGSYFVENVVFCKQISTCHASQVSLRFILKDAHMNLAQATGDVVWLKLKT